MISRINRFAAIAALLSICAISNAATIVDFKPTPTSPNTPEFQFSRAIGGGVPVFRSALGATSNNDGNLPVQNQIAPGLDSETPFILAGPGSLSDFVAGTTHFFDSALQFTGGLQANAPALNAGGSFIQQLSPGTFQLLSTGPAPILLLSGNIATASFIVGTGNAGAVFNASGINYTGGIMFNALVASGASPNNNSMSISMVDVTPQFNIAGDGFLGDFTTNATGLFNANVVPEPACLSLLMFAAGALLVRRR